MNTIFEFSLKHNGACLFLVVLLEQAGLPIPSAPCLLAAGALCAAGEASLGAVLGLTLLACLVADCAWYFTGQHTGKSMLRFLCRIGLTGGRGLEQVERDFARRGETVLAFAKFIPGISVLAPPMAGAVGIGLGEFLLFDTLGSALYAGAYLLLGCLFNDQLQALLAVLDHLGFWCTLLIDTAVAGWLIYHFKPWRAKLFRSAITPLQPITREAQ